MAGRASVVAARILAALAFAAAVAGVVYLALAPTTSSVGCGTSATGQFLCTRDSHTLIEANGARVIAYLLLPPALTALVVASISFGWSRALEFTAASLYLVACLLTGFSIGFVFIPSALLLFLAALVNRRPAPPLRSGRRAGV